jgi:hypothetical protein
MSPMRSLSGVSRYDADIVKLTLLFPTRKWRVHRRRAQCWYRNAQKFGLSAVGTAASFSVPYLCGFSEQTLSGQSRNTRR